MLFNIEHDVLHFGSNQQHVGRGGGPGLMNEDMRSLVVDALADIDCRVHADRIQNPLSWTHESSSGDGIGYMGGEVPEARSQNVTSDVSRMWRME